MLQKKDTSLQSAHEVFARKKLLDQELSRCLDILKTKRNTEKVILFGKMAKGEVNEWSDIDLVIVEKTSLPFYQRLFHVRKLLRPQVAMDVIVYTPDEFETMCADRAFVKDEIMNNGKVLYERSA